MASESARVEAGQLSDKAALKVSRTEHELERDELDTVGEERVRENENEEYKSHHTLESDEEEEEKYKRLDMKKVDGQEDATLEYDGEVKITPFNMKDELVEGHFDNTGNFIFDKKKEDVADAWLDGIDWSSVKKQAGQRFEGSSQEDPDAAAPGIADDDEEEFDAAEQRAADKRRLNLNRRDIYEKMLQYLGKPNESVLKALKRLGGSVSAQDARKQRWQQKKAAAKKEGATEEADKTPDADDKSTTDSTTVVSRLTELVDELVAGGEYDAYQFTKEKLQFELEQMERAAAGGHQAQEKDDVEEDMFAEPSTAAATTSPAAALVSPSATETPDGRPLRSCQKRRDSQGDNSNDGVTPKKVRFIEPGTDKVAPAGTDADAADTAMDSTETTASAEPEAPKIGPQLTGNGPPGQNGNSNKAAAANPKADDDSEGGVRWEFKWTNDDDAAEVHGPYSSRQMRDWQAADYFAKGVFVRKADADGGGGGQFYSAGRIDFDLYVD